MNRLLQTNNIAAILVLSAMLAFASCKKDAGTIKSPGPSFKPELFKQQLETLLAGARGYAFVITKNGQVVETGQGGIARIDRGDTLPMTPTTMINIASVTKTITATAFIRLMRYRDEIELDGEIGPWLPNGWTKNSAISSLTFREILTHTSGIRSGNTSWSSLRNVVANPLEGSKDYSYANVNFALFRAMIPKIHNKTLVDEKEATLSQAEFEQWLSDRYIRIIQDDLFKKIDLQNRECKPVPNQAQMFNEAPSALISAETGDWTNSCAAGGFYLTTMDMAKFMVYLTHENDFSKGFINPEERALMDSEQLGLNRNFSVTGGTALGHGGLLYQDVNQNGSQDAGEPGLQTIIVKFPIKVELALSINSMTNTGNGSRNTNSLVQTAFNNAWE